MARNHIHMTTGKNVSGVRYDVDLYIYIDIEKAM